MFKIRKSEHVEKIEEIDLQFPIYRKNYDGHWNGVVKITAVYYPVIEGIPEGTLDFLKVLYVRKDTTEIKHERLSCRPHIPDDLERILQDFDEEITKKEFEDYAAEVIGGLFSDTKSLEFWR